MDWWNTLEFESDLMFVRPFGTVEDLGDCVKVLSPQNPAYYYGNMLLLPEPVTDETAAHWQARFAEVFAPYPAVKHVNLGWMDSPQPASFPKSLVDEGFTHDQGVVLTCQQPALPGTRPSVPGVVFRFLTSEADFAQMKANQVKEMGGLYPLASFKAHQEGKLKVYRHLEAQGRGHWLGAFAGDALVAQLGIFIDPNLGFGRYQSVFTLPEYRGRGLATQMVVEAGQWALANGAKRLVIHAERFDDPRRLYEKTGFAPHAYLAAALRQEQG